MRAETDRIVFEEHARLVETLIPLEKLIHGDTLEMLLYKVLNVRDLVNDGGLAGEREAESPALEGLSAVVLRRIESSNTGNR